MARTYLNTVKVCVTIKFVSSFATIHGTLGSRGESQLRHALSLAQLQLAPNGTSSSLLQAYCHSQWCSAQLIYTMGPCSPRAMGWEAWVPPYTVHKEQRGTSEQQSKDSFERNKPINWKTYTKLPLCAMEPYRIRYLVPCNLCNESACSCGLYALRCLALTSFVRRSRGGLQQLNCTWTLGVLGGR